MQSEKSESTENLPDIGEMKKRRVSMADGRRYLIYYTFGNDSESPVLSGSISGTQNAAGEAADETESALDSSFIVPNSSLESGEHENV
jgi:hypothetical protein